MFDCWDLDGDFRTIKDCLDYVGWLNSQHELQQYLNTEIRKLDSYIRSTQNNSTANLSNVISEIDEFRKLLYLSVLDYGKYKNGTFSEGCDGGHIYNLSVCLHRLYRALLFLWFNTSDTEKGRGGGHWSTLSCNDSNSEFCKWLTSPHTSGSGLLAGGFSISNLNDINGKQIASNIEKVLNSNGNLQKCLYGLLFSPPWMPEKTANACLLAKQLCEEINKNGMTNKLPGEYADDYGAIQRICTKLLEAFAKLIKENNNGLLAVTHNGNKDLSPYNVEAQFADCFAFLKECLPELIESLGYMKEQCVSWTADNIKNAKTPGPFLYGFNLTEKCNPSSSGSEYLSQLTEAIDELVQNLNELNDILNPTSHAIAIGLGVVSTVLVGGSAAAGYLYPGFLSSTINMVVG